ncbi:MAG: glycosyltransferase family 2 protein [bacterium]
MRPSLSLVIPVYRNPNTLVRLHQELVKAVEDQAGVEMLFVDDHCPEDSFAVLRGLARVDDRVRIVRMSKNLGQNRAAIAGMACATGRTIVIMDADLQDPPSAIPRLIDSLDGFGAVFAGRAGEYESRSRLWSSRLFKWLLHICSGRRIPADAGLFLAMSREMCDQILQIRDSNPYLIELIGSTGLPLTSIKVERRPDTNRKSAYSLGMRAGLAWRAFSGPFRRWWNPTCPPVSSLKGWVSKEICRANRNGR